MPEDAGSQSLGDYLRLVGADMDNDLLIDLMDVGRTLSGALKIALQDDLKECLAWFMASSPEALLEAIKLGADPNVRGCNGLSPWRLALDRGDAEMVRYLLAAGVHCPPYDRKRLETLMLGGSA